MKQIGVMQWVRSMGNMQRVQAQFGYVPTDTVIPVVQSLAVSPDVQAYFGKQNDPQPVASTYEAMLDVLKQRGIQWRQPE